MALVVQQFLTPIKTTVRCVAIVLNTRATAIAAQLFSIVREENQDLSKIESERYGFRNRTTH